MLAMVAAVAVGAAYFMYKSRWKMDEIADVLAEGGVAVTLDERGDVTSSAVCAGLRALIKQNVGAAAAVITFRRRLDSMRTKYHDVSKRSSELLTEHTKLQAAHAELKSEYNILSERVAVAEKERDETTGQNLTLRAELEKLQRAAKRRR